MYENDIDLKPVADLLPVPTGYRLLVALPTVNQTTQGGVLKTETEVDRERTATIIAMVVALGPDAYKDTTKFPTGAWCSTGDWVMMRSYAGTRFMINGEEYRLINDDTVDAVVPDPRVIKRVGAVDATAKLSIIK